MDRMRISKKQSKTQTKVLIFRTACQRVAKPRNETDPNNCSVLLNRSKINELTVMVCTTVCGLNERSILN